MNVKLVMSLFIVGLMVLSVVGFVMIDADDSGKRVFGDVTFYKTLDGWRLHRDGSNFYFNFMPEEVLSIPVDDVAVGVFVKSPILGIAYDPEDMVLKSVGVIQQYMEQVLAQNQRTYVVRGVSNTSRYPSLPLLSCSNASEKFPVLMFLSGNETRITSKGWCLNAEVRSSSDVFRLADRVLFTALGVV